MFYIDCEIVQTFLWLPFDIEHFIINYFNVKFCMAHALVEFLQVSDSYKFV